MIRSKFSKIKIEYAESVMMKTDNVTEEFFFSHLNMNQSSSTRSYDN